MAIVNISFDYEMSWGLLSRSMFIPIKDNVSNNVLAGASNVLIVLDKLKEYDLYTTWGIVAATTYKSWDELQSATPIIQGELQKIGILDIDSLRKHYPNGELFFSSDLVNEIINGKNNEIVSHGGYHLYLGDKELPDSVAYEDLQFSVKRLSQLVNKKICGFIAPRNQVHKEKVINETGINTIRPNPLLFNCVRYSSEMPFAGSLRLYSDLVSPFYCRYQNKNAALVFLRIDRNDIVFEMQYNLIKKMLSNCGDDYIFFFYIHPHNFANKVSLQRFLRFIELFSELRDSNKISLHSLDGKEKKII